MIVRPRLAVTAVFAALGLLTTATACVQGGRSAPSATPESNIGIAQSQIDAAAVERLLSRVDEVRGAGQGRGQVGLDEVLSFLPATDDERQAVLAAHPDPMPITCDGDVCTAVSDGSEVYVTLSQLDQMPAWFGPRVVVKLRWRGPSQLELCGINGFQVRKVFWVSVDGAFIDAHGADGSSFVDVSVGGSYPNC